MASRTTTKRTAAKVDASEETTAPTTAPAETVTDQEAEDAADALFAGKGAPPTMGPGHERIQSRLFAIDELAECDALETGLKIGTATTPVHRADYATLLDALDAAEDNARRAHRLYVNGKLALAAFEIDIAVFEADMYAKASNRLEEQKAKGERTKTITDADVRAAMAGLFPDQVRDHATRLQKAKRSVDYFERLADLWKSRCRTLDVMVSTARR